MNQLDILLPFGFLPPEFSTDLMRVLRAPALATLLTRTRFNTSAVRTHHYNEFARCLPYEEWVAQRFGIDASLTVSGSPPIATALMRSFDLPASAGYWFLVQPIHIHIASDHLILTDVRQLALSDDESRTLFQLAETAFTAGDKQLLYGDAMHWFVHANDWATLQTSTPDAVCGRSIDIWTPKGDGERAWRKLQNEVQMEWHEHPLNESREEQGKKAVNSIWLWGGASAARTGHSDYQQTFGLAQALAGYAQFSRQHHAVAQLDQVINAGPGHHLLVLDALIEAALAGDWSVWLEQMHALEQDWFVPLLAALQNGKIQRINLICSNSAQLMETSTSSVSLKAFWRKPTLQRLRA